MLLLDYYVMRTSHLPVPGFNATLQPLNCKLLTEGYSMNIKCLSLILLFTATGAFAADGNDSPALDIQQIISSTPTPGSCQVEPATLVYLDSQGVSHTVNYTVMGTCQGGV